MILGNEWLNCDFSCQSQIFPYRWSSSVLPAEGFRVIQLSLDTLDEGKPVSWKWSQSKVGSFRVSQGFLMKNRHLHPCSQQLGASPSVPFSHPGWRVSWPPPRSWHTYPQRIPPEPRSHGKPSRVALDCLLQSMWSGLLMRCWKALPSLTWIPILTERTPLRALPENKVSWPKMLTTPSYPKVDGSSGGD